jgi:hypothetical protein
MQNSDFLKNKFEHFHADVPTEVWDNVVAALDDKKKRRPIFWWFSGIAALLVVVLYLGCYFANDGKQFAQHLHHTTTNLVPLKPKIEEMRNRTQTTPITKQSDHSEKPSKNLAIKVRNQNYADKNQNANEKWVEAMLKNETNSIELLEIPSNQEQIVISEAVNADSAVSKIETDVIAKVEIVTSNGILPIKTDDNVVKSKKWELALFGGFSATRQQNSPYFLESSIANSPNLDFTANNADYLNISASSSNFISPVIRFTLIKAGLSINRELLPRWRLESGLHYLRFGVFYENSQVWSRETQMVQMPVSAHYAVIQANRIDWRLGSGVGMSYVFKQANPVFRGEWFNNTTILYKINPSWSIFLQPEARVVFYDSRIQGMGKLSQWYWGANLGVVMRF